MSSIVVNAESDGPLLIAVMAVGRMILDCYYWQTLDDRETSRKVYVDALPLPDGKRVFTRSDLEALRPFALLWQAPGDGYNLRASSTSTLHVTGHVIVQFELPVPEHLAEDDHGLGIHLMRSIGRIVRTQDPDRPGLMDMSGDPGRPFINHLQIGTYQRVEKDYVTDVGDHAVVDLDMHWGYRG